MKFLRIWLALAALVTAEVRSSRFAERPAWTIETPRLRVTILEGGGHVAEIVLAEESAVNPLWVQLRPTIDPDQYNPKLHEKVYGGGSGARLMSGLAGHNVWPMNDLLSLAELGDRCFDINDVAHALACRVETRLDPCSVDERAPRQVSALHARVRAPRRRRHCILRGSLEHPGDRFSLSLCVFVSSW